MNATTDPPDTTADLARTNAGGLPDITTALARIDPAVPVDVVIDALGKMDLLKRIVREADRQLEELALEWIARNQQDIVVSPTLRYYAGVRKDRKCRDTAATLDRACELAGGDIKRVAEAMVSQPFRVGPAMRDLLGGEFEQHFETVEVAELREGVAKKRLLKHDEAFAR